MTSVYTCAGSYKEYFKSLPDDIPELGRLICSQVIHRVTLREGNTNANASPAYGDMTNDGCPPKFLYFILDCCHSVVYDWQYDRKKTN
jgi:hypothetical protein